MIEAERAIRTARMRWNAAIAAGDATGAVGPITRDAVLIPAGGDPLVGRAAITRAWRKLLGGGGRFVREVERVETGEGGVVAAEFGRWRGEHGTAGCYLAEWRQGIDGWQCSREVYVQLAG